MLCITGCDNLFAINWYGMNLHFDAVNILQKLKIFLSVLKSVIMDTSEPTFGFQQEYL